MTTKLIPALLSSTGLRDQLGHRTEPAFGVAATTIDAIRTRFEALSTLHSTPDPSLTKESRALRYATQLKTTRQNVLAGATAAIGALSNLEDKLRTAAIKQAKLDVRLQVSEEAEFRSALREMSPEERTAAIVKAASDGQGWMLNAVRYAPSPVTIGSHTAPINDLVDLLLHNANPGLQADLDDIQSAVNHVTFALDAFARHSESMRDPVLEDQGQQHADAIRGAEAALRDKVG